jgi:hypothetical protein
MPVDNSVFRQPPDHVPITTSGCLAKPITAGIDTASSSITTTTTTTTTTIMN